MRSRTSKTFKPNGDKYSTAASAASVRQHQTTKSRSATRGVHVRGRTRIENGKQSPTTKLGAESSNTPSSGACLKAGRRTSCVSGRRNAGANANEAGIQFRLRDGIDVPRALTIGRADRDDFRRDARRVRAR